MHFFIIFLTSSSFHTKSSSYYHLQYYRVSQENQTLWYSGTAALKQISYQWFVAERIASHLLTDCMWKVLCGSWTTCAVPMETVAPLQDNALAERTHSASWLLTCLKMWFCHCSCECTTVGRAGISSHRAATTWNANSHSSFTAWEQCHQWLWTCSCGWYWCCSDGAIY